MKIKEQAALISLCVMISLTTSKAMNIVRKDDGNSPSREIMENPTNNFLDGPLLSILMDNNSDGPTIGDTTDQLPVFPDDESATTIKYSVLEDEIPVENPNDTMDNFAESDFAHDSTNNFEDNPTVLYIRPQARAFSMEVREFHECVSCNSDNEARKHYNECLLKLSPKNQEIIQSCCIASFDSDFCSKASTGKINYKAICEDPEKALTVGDCFWQKIQDKDTDDIKLYRLRIIRTTVQNSPSAISSNKENELRKRFHVPFSLLAEIAEGEFSTEDCKKQILVRYCTNKSYNIRYEKWSDLI